MEKNKSSFAKMSFYASQKRIEYPLELITNMKVEQTAVKMLFDTKMIFYPVVYMGR